MTSAEQTLWEHLLATVHACKRALYIGSHPLFLSRRRQELLVATHGFAGITWLTLEQFAEKLLQAQGHAWVRIHAAIREDIVESVVQHLCTTDQLPHLQPGLAHPHMSKSLALWIEDLSKGMGTGWSHALPAAEHGLLHDLHRVATTYFNWTGAFDNPFAEREEVLRMATTLLQTAPLPEWMGEAVFVEGFFLQTPAEEKLWEALQATSCACQFHLPAAEPQGQRPEWGTCALRWYAVETPQLEAEAAAEEVVRLVGAGVPLTEVAIVVPDEASRTRVARELLARNCPTRTSLPVMLLHLEATQHLLGLLTLAETDAARSPLLQVALHVGAAGTLSADSLAWGRDRIRQSGIRGGLSNWRRLFASILSKGRQRLLHLNGTGDTAAVTARVQKARHWLRLLRHCRAFIQKIPATSSWSTMTQAVLTAVEALAQRTTSPLDRVVLMNIHALLRTRLEIAVAWEAAGQEGASVSLARFRLWLYEKLAQTPFDQQEQRSDGVAIYLPDESCGGQFAHVLMMGMVEEQFPTGYAPHWIWELCRDLADTRAHHAQEQWKKWLWAASTARHELIAFSPKRLDSGQPVPPSRFLQRWGGEPSAYEGDRVQAHTPRPSSQRVAESVPVPFFQPEQPIHVTGLDLYRRCAFRFFAERVLGVHERLDRSEGLLALDRGNVAHRVLRQLLETTAPEADAFLEQAEALLREELRAFASTWHLSGAVWQEQENRLTFELQRFISQERVRLLQEPGQRLLEWGFGIVHEEKMSPASTPEPLIIQRGDRKVALCGIVDRIDVHNGQFRVVDYKWSSSPTAEEMATGGDLQVPLYLLAFHRLHSDAPRPAGGQYASIREPGQGGSIAFDEETLPFPAFVEQVSDQVLQLAERAAQGDVRPLPVHPSECQHCSVRTVCRHRERRHENT